MRRVPPRRRGRRHRLSAHARAVPGRGAVVRRLRANHGRGSARAPRHAGMSVRVGALEGDLDVPDGATGIVLFAHGSGSSRFSSRNRYVAQKLRNGGLGTLLIDLLTAREEAIDERTRHLRFDIDMLAQRLAGATRWLGAQTETRDMPVGVF